MWEWDRADAFPYLGHVPLPRWVSPRWAQEFHNHRNMVGRVIKSLVGGVTLTLFQAGLSLSLEHHCPWRSTGIAHQSWSSLDQMRLYTPPPSVIRWRLLWENVASDKGALCSWGRPWRSWQLEAACWPHFLSVPEQKVFPWRGIWWWISVSNISFVLSFMFIKSKAYVIYFQFFLINNKCIWVVNVPLNVTLAAFHRFQYVMI